VTEHEPEPETINTGPSMAAEPDPQRLRLGPLDRVLYLAAAMTGLRQGELLGVSPERVGSLV
jgi:hypothetical protein